MFSGFGVSSIKRPPGFKTRRDSCTKLCKSSKEMCSTTWNALIIVKLSSLNSLKYEIPLPWVTSRLSILHASNIPSSKSIPFALIPFSLSSSNHSPLPQPISKAFTFGYKFFSGSTNGKYTDTRSFISSREPLCLSSNAL